MKRLKWLLLLVTTALLGFVGLVWWAGPTNVTSMEHFDKIVRGMTDREVVQLLTTEGDEGTVYMEEGRGEIWVLKINTFAPWGEPPGRWYNTVTHWKEWRTADGPRISVAFDGEQKVVGTVKFTFADSESWLDRIRRFLRLG